MLDGECTRSWLCLPDLCHGSVLLKVWLARMEAELKKNDHRNHWNGLSHRTVHVKDYAACERPQLSEKIKFKIDNVFACLQSVLVSDQWIHSKQEEICSSSTVVFQIRDGKREYVEQNLVVEWTQKICSQLTRKSFFAIPSHWYFNWRNQLRACHTKPDFVQKPDWDRNVSVY